MENLKQYTPIELLKLINNKINDHNELKKEIINETTIIDELKKKVNLKLEKLEKIEIDYVQLIEELTSRDNDIREETDITK